MKPHTSILVRYSLLATSALLIASNVRSAEAAPDRGLDIGAKAPAFTLKDADGKNRSLSEFTSKGKVALVFYRSADW